MADTDLIKSPLYPLLRMGNTVIWDLTNFDNTDRQELLNNDTITEPAKLDEDHITFCKGDFNIKSLIYENATPEDIMEAWGLVKDELKLNRLVKLFLRDSMHNLYLTKNLHEEPDLILILRLVYWYYRCKKLTDSFIHKRKEVRDGMTRRLLRRREEISSQLDADLTDREINTLVSNLELILVKNRAVKKEADRYRNQWFTNTWNVTSELLFAGVCGEKGFNVTFVPKSRTHDHDFIVDGCPVQVKSFNTPVLVNSMVRSKRRRKLYVERNKITYDLAISMVKEAMLDKSGELDDALEQGAKIIFVNGTSDESGAFFSQHCFGSGGSFTFEKSVRASINLANSNESSLPIIYCSTGIRLHYLVYALPFRAYLYTVGDKRKVDRKSDIEVIKSS